MPTLQRLVSGRFEWLDGPPEVRGGSVLVQWTAALPESEAQRHPLSMAEAHAYAGFLAAAAPDEGIIPTYIGEAPPPLRVGEAIESVQAAMDRIKALLEVGP